MWKQMAEALRLNIPEAEMEKVAAILDSVYASIGPALDRDLSTIEPAGVFRVQGPERK